MSEAPNPYQPPAQTTGPAIVAQADWAAQPDGRITFEVALTEQDVQRFFPNPIPFGFLRLLIGLLIAMMALAIGSRLLLLLLAVLTVLLLLARWRLNWRMALRQTPRLLEPVSGYITERGFFASSNGCRGNSRWEDLHSIKTTRHGVLISGENWRLVSLIIPWTCFSDPVAAQQAMASLLQQRKSWKSLALGDARLLQSPKEEILFPPEGTHVAFDGSVTFGDIAASGPGRKLRRTVYRLLPIPFILLIAASLSLLGGLTVALLFGFPLFVFSIALIVQLARHPLARRHQSRVAFRSRGWFDDSGFFLQSATGQSLRQWRSVARQWHDQSMLCICLPGVSEGWFFFSRGQFANDDDFQKACRWSEAGLGHA